MMYCPSSVGAYGICVKHSCGKKNNGSIVPGICKNNSSNVVRTNFPLSNPNPISDSHTARIGNDTPGCIIPNVNVAIVFPASASAGLAPAKNFSTPNHKNTTPSDILKNGIAYAAITRVIRRSIPSGGNLVIPTSCSNSATQSYPV